MNKYLVMALSLILLLNVACSSDKGEAAIADQKVESIEQAEQSGNITNSSLISNPITADDVVSPETAAKIEFEEEVFDFGDIEEGESVEHLFKFKNTGENPLVISNAKGSCGCTVPEWPRSPIAPGGKGEIKVIFNSKGKTGSQNKTVTIMANTLPNETLIRIVGKVANTEEAK